MGEKTVVGVRACTDTSFRDRNGTYGTSVVPYLPYVDTIFCACSGSFMRFCNIVSYIRAHVWSRVASRDRLTCSYPYYGSMSKKLLESMATGIVAIPKESAAIVDNPCWGSPTSCALSDLLKMIDKPKRILFEDANYVVLNKPADLRMDGSYPSTVEKLLRFWFRDETTKDLGEDEMIAALHHAMPTWTGPERLRHCHQLDYATSGILLFAKSTVAANQARIAFESRTVKKTYTALVQGKVDIPSSWPIWSRTQLRTTLEGIESDHKRQRSKAEKWKGYVPAHALFQKWQHNQNHLPPSKQKRRKLSRTLDESHWKQVWDLIDSSLSQQERQLASKLKWKELKQRANSQKLMQPFQAAEQLYNQLTPHIAPVALDNSLPPNVAISEEANSFAVTTPIAVNPNGFAMLIPPGNEYMPGSEKGEFKPSVTVATIMAKSNTATLLRLEPWTGRRHQLRVHCATIGNPVIGDVTYGTRSKRLCLHSTSLNVPGILDVTSDPPFGIHNGQIRLELL